MAIVFLRFLLFAGLIFAGLTVPVVSHPFHSYRGSQNIYHHRPRSTQHHQVPGHHFHYSRPSFSKHFGHRSGRAHRRHMDHSVPVRRHRIHHSHGRRVFTPYKKFTRLRTKRIVKGECKKYLRFRSTTGKCNNLRNPRWGSFNSPKFRLTRPARVRDGRNTRKISNIIAREPFVRRNRRRMSELVVFFGQFLDHTIAASEESETAMNIEIPSNDPVFRTRSFIPFKKSVQIESFFGRGMSPVNALTSYIDGSATYGSTARSARRLRMFTRGDLRMDGKFLQRDPKTGRFISGDSRVNENPHLTVMHTLFAREHNRVAEEVREAYPDAKDSFLFELTRLICGAELQAIVYYEFIPAVMGRLLPPYRGYNPYKIGSATNEFTTVAFRVGHTMVNPTVTSIDDDGDAKQRLLRDTFFRPDLFLLDGMDGLLRGMMKERAGEIDTFVTKEILDFLISSKSPVRLDLIALNLQRGRDHGVAPYNSLRRQLGLKPVRKFSDISSSVSVQRRLRAAYGDVDKIDAWVGGAAEDHTSGSLGPLFSRIWRDQFTRLRDGDRFYFENPKVFTKYQIYKIPTLNRLLGNNRSLGQIMQRIIIDNTELSSEDVKSRPFFV